MDWISAVIGLAAWTVGVWVLSRAFAAERLREVGLDQAAGLAGKNWRKRTLTGIGVGLGASAWLFVTKWYLGVFALLVGYLLTNVFLPRLWLLYYRSRVRRLASADSAASGTTSPTMARETQSHVDQVFNEVLDPVAVAQNEKTRAMIRNWSEGLAENNYEYFAFNIAALVAVLNRHYRDRFPSEDALLATSGVLNLLQAVQAGRVSVEDMTHATLDAHLCQVSLGLERLVHADAATQLCGGDSLLNFTMQHAALGFRATDDELSDRDILHAVVQQKEAMASALTRTNKAIESGKLDSKMSFVLQALVRGFMESDETAGVRQVLGLRDA